MLNFMLGIVVKYVEYQYHVMGFGIIVDSQVTCAPFSAPSIGWSVPLWTRPTVGLSWLPFAYLSYSFLSSFVDSTTTPSTALHPAVGFLWSLRPGAMTGSIFPSDIPSQPRSHYPRSVYES